MRLTDFEQKMIKKAFIESFEEGEIYLFGSRVDENKRGGDIDLYLIPSQKFDNERDRKIKFLVKLDLYIGEQKIDVILAKDSSRLIEQEALKYGVKLWKILGKLLLKNYMSVRLLQGNKQSNAIGCKSV